MIYEPYHKFVPINDTRSKCSVCGIVVAPHAPYFNAERVLPPCTGGAFLPSSITSGRPVAHIDKSKIMTPKKCCGKT